jgi:photosystem II stability/assembly factor-like uncharacterized protein
MKRKFYLVVLIGAVWILKGGVAGALPLWAAEVDHKKASAAFEHVHALAMDADARALLLGAHTGLFRGDDGGRSWKKVALPAKNSHLDVMAVTADPKDAGTIYIGTHEAGVFKSTDGGVTWKQMNNGLGGMDVHGLAIDPNAPSKLHAAVREKGEGIYRSTDGGGKWVRVDDGPKAK